MDSPVQPQNCPTRPVPPDLPQVTIIGPGLLGASVGVGLKKAGFAGRIVGFSRTKATLDGAMEVGAIDEGFTDLGPAVQVDGKCIVVVCVPVGRFGDIFRQLAEHQRRGMYVTDVGSTKLSVVADAKRFLKQPQFFVPAHPMAGSEKSGPSHADPELFVGKPCVMCPDDATDANALATIRQMWESLGGVIHLLTADAHDHEVAAVSHLPHLLSVLLTLTADDIGPLDLASSGFRDTSRLALSNPAMRRDIIAANHKPIGEALDRFASRLNELRGVVRKAKDEELIALLESAQAKREAWPGSSKLSE
ncbi:MAG: prephenate dehydrogenase [Planctomycetota bacterium]